MVEITRHLLSPSLHLSSAAVCIIVHLHGWEYNRCKMLGSFQKGWFLLAVRFPFHHMCSVLSNLSGILHLDLRLLECLQEVIQHCLQIEQHHSWGKKNQTIVNLTKWQK